MPRARSGGPAAKPHAAPSCAGARLISATRSSHLAAFALHDAPDTRHDLSQTPQDAFRPPPGGIQDTSKTPPNRPQLEHICMSCFDCVICQFLLLVCITYHEHSQYRKTCKTIGFYSMFALSSVLTLARLHSHPNRSLAYASFYFENHSKMQLKTAPTRSKTDHEYDMGSNWQKISPRTT